MKDEMVTTVEAVETKQRIDFNLAARWVALAQVKSSSIKSYNKGVRRLKEYFEANNITTPTFDNLAAYREYLGANYQPSTANLYITAAKLFLSFLHIEGYLPTNPGERLKNFKISQGHKKSALTAEATRGIIASFDDTTLAGARNKAMYVLMTSCGLRCVEVQRATVSDIEFVGGVIKLHVWGKGRNDKTESVILPAGVYNLIQSYLSKRGKVDGDAPLFASLSNRNKGGKMATNSISRIIKGALRANGFDSPRLTAHSLRATAATAALKAGAPLREVQQLLRHRNVATTQIYLHDLDELNNTASTLAAASFGI